MNIKKAVTLVVISSVYLMLSACGYKTLHKPYPSKMKAELTLPNGEKIKLNRIGDAIGENGFHLTPDFKEYTLFFDAFPPSEPIYIAPKKKK